MISNIITAYISVYSS